MSDKPLAEKWCEESKRCKQIADECGDDSVFAQSVRYWMCADELKKFAAEHLTEQTEPSANDWILARTWNHGVMHVTEPHRCSRCMGLAEALLSTRNAERRRIRELLVGKERP